MKVLVFGATGGTGGRLVQQALQQGHVVTAFARDPGKIHLVHDNLRVVRGDILHPDSVETLEKLREYEPVSMRGQPPLSLQKLQYVTSSFPPKLCLPNL